MKGNSGAVSVQAVFMMLVLVTLGTFAITSARVNYTFSLKALNWNKMYYALEDKAERYLKDVDAVLINASEKDDYLNEARAGLEGLNGPYPGSVVGADGEGLYLSMNFVSDENENANLRVSLRITNNAAVGAGRYKITEWTEWQRASEEYEGLGLWDGFF